MKWADKYRTLKVRTNADTPADAKRAREFGAEGIGLCRTEHMFFEGDRIIAMREMILADNEEDRKTALDEAAAVPAEGLHRHLHGDERPAGHDPPARSAAARIPAARRQEPGRNGQGTGRHAGRRQGPRRAAARSEPDARPPRLPSRASPIPRSSRCRSRAIIEAAIACKKKKIDAQPEIMIPLVGTAARTEDARASRPQTTIDEVQRREEVQGQAGHSRSAR